jgi:hypothetical protein
MPKDLKENPVLTVGMLLALLMGGGSGAVSILGNGDGKEAHAAAIKLAERLTTIELDIRAIADDRATMAKHWALHQWAKDEINSLRAKQDLDAARWPPFN